MRYKTTKKILIDKMKLDILLRLNCSTDVLMDLILYNKLTKTGDALIDENLESLIDVKEFHNWGGKRPNSGRKNQLEKQFENQDENQLEKQDANQDEDKDKDKDKDIEKDILPSSLRKYIKKPNKENIEEFSKLIGKKIDSIDNFIVYYSSGENPWCDKSGIPIDWQRAYISWYMREQARKKKYEEKPKVPRADW